MKHVLFSILLLISLSLQAGESQECSLPPRLDNEISRKFLGKRVITLADILDEHDRKLFRKEHGSRCPGLVKVNFYGDGNPTWALVLINSRATKREAELVVARQIGLTWELRSVDTAGDAVPVIWSEPPGAYEDVYEEKKITAKYPVIMLVSYESWAIVYAWAGNKVEKVWLAD